MYAVLVFELEYSCGNVYGIFDNEEDAINECKQFTINKHPTGDYFYDSHNVLDVRVVKIETNKIYTASFTNCANCMTRSRYTGTNIGAVSHEKYINTVSDNTDTADAITDATEVRQT